MIRFVIPAAGNATRFGGTLKELLPISEQDCGLSHAVRLAHRLGECDPVVVTTVPKWYWHEKALKSRGLTAKFIIKHDPEDGDMWGSILKGIDPDMDGGIILPDSVAEVESIPSGRGAISFGYFVTQLPGRFSCLVLSGPEASINTKLQDTMPGIAWGIVVWSAPVARKLLHLRDHYDRAFEYIMRDDGFTVFQLDGYHDLGSFNDYKEYLNANRTADHVA